MEVVEEFKVELHSLYDSKLPVSRAKMGIITKLAMKSIKFYKHVVMIVEKFVAKSGPPYKLPALYVIDSIIRQSRHQFQGQKEVYGPRFGSKLDKLFPHILECLEIDRPKVAKVLNLWLKNGVYPPEVLRPLLDQMGGSNMEQSDVQNTTEAIAKKDTADVHSFQGEDQTYNTTEHQSDIAGNEQNINQHIEHSQKSNNNVVSHNKSKRSVVANEFSKALLDNFDYSSDEDNESSFPMARIDSSPSHDNKSHDINDATAIIDQMEEQFRKQKKSEMVTAELQQRAPPLSPPTLMTNTSELVRPMAPPQMHLPPHDDWTRPPQINSHYPPPPNSWRDWGSPHHAPPLVPPPSHMRDDRYRQRSPLHYPEERRGRHYYRSHDDDFDKRRRYHRHDDRDWRHGRDRSPLNNDVKTTYHKNGHITVYSTTVWLGHLNKTFSQEELRQKIEQLGRVKSVDYIVARGCAYIVMETREDSEKAMDKLRDILDIKCKIAWAPGRGVKGKLYQPFWEESSGLSNIPWDVVKSSSELESLGMGGIIDTNTLPPHLIKK